VNSDVRARCEAKTKRGKRCKNYALAGGRFCHTHQQDAARTQEPAAGELQELVKELDHLVADLKAAIPTKGPYGMAADQPEKLVQFLKDNLDRITPDVAKGIAATFQGATIEDLMDPETWKGMGYMLNYSMRFQMEQLKQRLMGEDGNSD
jgi:hypothetical protein